MQSPKHRDDCLPSPLSLSFTALFRLRSSYRPHPILVLLFSFSREQNANEPPSKGLPL